MLGGERTRAGGTVLTARTRTAAKPRRKGVSAKAAAVAAARTLDAMKAEDVLVLDVTDVSPLAEYFVLATGSGARHVNAMAQDVVATLKEMGIRSYAEDGFTQGTWAVVDFGPLVVHCFQRTAREFYDLEMLWGDGKKVRWKAAAEKRASA